MQQTLFAWGANSHGQLGTGACEDSCLPIAATLGFLEEHETVVQITGGGGHSMLVTSHGRLFASGWNHKGQLGLGDLQDRCGFAHVPLPTGIKAELVACGWDFTVVCGRDCTSRQLLFSCGSNKHGQLGFSSGGQECVSSLHTLGNVLVGDDHAKQLAAGLYFCLVLTENGRVFGWGHNRSKQLSPLSADTVPFPIRLDCEALLVMAVAAGQRHSVFLAENGTVFVRGTRQARIDCPEEPSLDAHASCWLEQVQLAEQPFLLSGWNHMLMVEKSGRVRGLGKNEYGQLGHDVSGLLSPNSQIIQAVSGSEHTLLLSGDHRVLSWGWNEHGTCGLGYESEKCSPAFIPRLADVSLIGAGAAFCFALGSLALAVLWLAAPHLGASELVALDGQDQDQSYSLVQDDFQGSWAHATPTVGIISSYGPTPHGRNCRSIITYGRKPGSILVKFLGTFKPPKTRIAEKLVELDKHIKTQVLLHQDVYSRKRLIGRGMVEFLKDKLVWSVIGIIAAFTYQYLSYTGMWNVVSNMWSNIFKPYANMQWSTFLTFWNAVIDRQATYKTPLGGIASGAQVLRDDPSEFPMEYMIKPAVKSVLPSSVVEYVLKPAYQGMSAAINYGSEVPGRIVTWYDQVPARYKASTWFNFYPEE